MVYVLNNPELLDLTVLSKELEVELGRGIAMSVVGNQLYVHNAESEEKKIVDVIEQHLSSDARELREARANNKLAVLMRSKAYKEEADGLFFKAQAGEIELDEWKAKRLEIKKRFPKVEGVDDKPKRTRRKKGSVE
jgi:hypothetical protein